MNRKIYFLIIFLTNLVLTNNVYGQHFDISGNWTGGTLKGTRKLVGDVTLTNTVEVAAGTTLEIYTDGTTRTIKATFNGKMFFVHPGADKNSTPGKLIIHGSSQNDKVIIDGGSILSDGGNNKLVSSGGIVRQEEIIHNQGTLDLDYVTIQNAYVDRSRHSGGAIYINGAKDHRSGKTEVTNCIIKHCCSDHGAAIHVAAQNQTNTGNTAARCAITLNNTTIENCYAKANTEGGVIRTNGGGVGNLTIEKCTIRNNRSEHSGGGLYWNAKGNTDTRLTIKGSLFQNNTAGLRGGAMMLETDFYFEGDETTIDGNRTDTNGYGGGIVVTSYGGQGITEAQLINGKYTYDFDFNLDDKLKIVNNQATDGAGISFNLGTFILNKRDFVDNDNANIVVNVHVNINGATISNNIATATGGGVRLLNATAGNNGKRTINIAVNMNKGTLSGNKAANGAGFYTSNTDITNTASDTDELVMSGNIATNNGGGIYVDGGKSISLKKNTMNSNKAKNGAAIYLGGTSGVSVKLGETEMNSNKSSEDGGAIYVSGGSLTLGKTKMDDNTAQRNGGAVYVAGTGSGFSTTGAIEMKRNSSIDGGAIFVSGGSVALGTATIDDNHASNNGGAICITNGAFSMADGSVISNNTAEKLGGGLYVFNENSSAVDVTCSGGSFSKNKAILGGGACMNGKINLNIASTFEANEAKNGGAIYMMKGVAMNFGAGLIRANHALKNSDSDYRTTAYRATYNSEMEGLVACGENAIYGFGAGIFMDNNTSLTFTKPDEFGLYNNSADSGADDIFLNGNGTTVTLPVTKEMNLKGFNVPNELYWVEDYPTSSEDPAITKYPNVENGPGPIRYDEALADGDRTLGILENKTNSQEPLTLTNYYACITLGYDLVFVNFIKSGLNKDDDATFIFSYKNNADDYVDYNKVIITGDGNKEITKTVALPSGEWKIKESGWSWKYTPKYYDSREKTKEIDFKTESITITRSGDKEYFIENTLRTDISGIKEFEHRKRNLMRP